MSKQPRTVSLVFGIYATGRLGVYAEWVLALERIHVLSHLH